MAIVDTPFLVEASGLTKSYRGATRPAIIDVSRRVRAGEILGVIGPNGAGKTSLMACLLGLLKPEAGWARLHGHPAGSLRANALVGYLPEGLRFDVWMTGRSFVAFQLRGTGGVIERLLSRLFGSASAAMARSSRLNMLHDAFTLALLRSDAGGDGDSPSPHSFE